MVSSTICIGLKKSASPQHQRIVRVALGKHPVSDLCGIAPLLWPDTHSTKGIWGLVGLIKGCIDNVKRYQNSMQQLPGGDGCSSKAVNTRLIQDSALHGLVTVA